MGRRLGEQSVRRRDAATEATGMYLRRLCDRATFPEQRTIPKAILFIPNLRIHHSHSIYRHYPPLFPLYRLDPSRNQPCTLNSRHILLMTDYCFLLISYAITPAYFAA